MKHNNRIHIYSVAPLEADVVVPVTQSKGENI